ncbi:MAG TPA: winged helix-turn-helix domain-containing protein, partial [Candidatus Acidoferrum sp.]|nr:winged helix-turn-helix domain-containing protein [Candidatus Acidoferrum sp.]
PAMPDAAQPLVRFGNFELDLQSGELQRNGHRRRLPQQSFRILTILLKRPGEVVTREELRKELWPEDTFVDFEHGVNSAVRRLRAALNDAADEPKFIETLPRLGYRYLGPPVTNRPLHAREGRQTAVVEERTKSPASNGVPERLSYTLGHSADNPTFIETIPRKGYKFIAPEEVFQRDEYKPRDGLKAAVEARAVRPGRKNLLVLVGACAAILLFALIFWRLLREPRVTRVVRLTNDARVRSPFRQPVTDGLHLYFVEGATVFSGSGIAQMSALGGETTQLVTPLGEPSAIYGISPDFSELLVANGASGRPDPATIWAQPLPAGTPRRVGNIHASAASYTPDGTQILYADGDSLIKINRDGSNPRELAKVPRDLIKFRGVALRGLRYSPDGKRIRFHIGGWPSDTSSLWEIEANGSNLHALLPNWKEASSQCCGNWSPDGHYYFFEGRQGNDQAIWVMPEHRYIFAGGPGKY